MFDIIFISYNEPNAEENFANLYDRFNTIGILGDRIKRVKNVKGIHNAHVEAAKLSNTRYFYVVDGDAVIEEDFRFDYEQEDNDVVHVWRCKNPVNDLVYGYGGVKLLPTKLTKHMDTTTKDMTTSISSKFKVVDQISNVTKFDTSPFETWKGAFRECAKLASKTIQRQNEEETNERLKIWTTVANGVYSRYAIRGANAGMEFGISSSNNLELINDFDWLKETFNNNG
jgi:hypothetical protein